MARFYGVIGYGKAVETVPGVWEDVITEQKLFGDVLRDTRRSVESDKVNNDLTVGNRISVVASPKILEAIQAVKYITWLGTYWTISDVEVEPPRIIFGLGGVYAGEKATAPSPA